MMRLCAALAGLFLLSGCAFTEESIPVRYTGAANLSVTPGAKDVTVEVKSTDGRVSNKDRVSSKKNGYGNETARILATNDVIAEVGKAVETELASLGFKIGPNGLKLEVEVLTFYSDFKSGFWSGEAVADVSFSLLAKKADGTLIFSRTYRAVGNNPDIMMASGSNAQPALEAALRNAVQVMVNDTDFHNALVKAGKPGAPTS